MEYTTWTGEACYTQAECAKLTERINKSVGGNGNSVTEIRGVWTHYTHWKLEGKDKDSEAKLKELLPHEVEQALEKKQGMFLSWFG